MEGVRADCSSLSLLWSLYELLRKVWSSVSCARLHPPCPSFSGCWQPGFKHITSVEWRPAGLIHILLEDRYLHQKLPWNLILHNVAQTNDTPETLCQSQ